MVAIESRYCPLFPIVAHVKIYMSLNCYTSVPTEPLSIDILLSAWLIFLFSSIERALSSSSFRTEKQKEILKLFEAFWWWFLGPVLNVNRNDTVKKITVSIMDEWRNDSKYDTPVRQNCVCDFQYHRNQRLYSSPPLVPHVCVSESGQHWPR